MSSGIGSPYLELDRNAVDGDPFRDELDAHRALEVLAEIVVVKPRDQVALSYSAVPQQDNLFISEQFQRYIHEWGASERRVGAAVAAQLNPEETLGVVSLGGGSKGRPASGGHSAELCLLLDDKSRY